MGDLLSVNVGQNQMRAQLRAESRVAAVAASQVQNHVVPAYRKMRGQFAGCFVIPTRDDVVFKPEPEAVNVRIDDHGASLTNASLASPPDGCASTFRPR